MRRIITMTAYRRPAYTREVLASLANCEGIGDWILLPGVEPGYEEVIAAFRRWTACELRLTINRNRLGLNRNTRETLHRASQAGAEVLVHLEDDTVPSPDALRYFDWAVRELLVPDVRSADGSSLLLASGYNKPPSPPLAEESHRCGIRPVWTPWGWGTDQKRLAWLIAHWSTRNPRCFTCHFRWNFWRTRREVYPILSRIQNIGYRMGENGRSAEWYRKNHRAPWVAGLLPERPPDFTLAPG